MCWRQRQAKCITLQQSIMLWALLNSAHTCTCNPTANYNWTTVNYAINGNLHRISLETIHALQLVFVLLIIKRSTIIFYAWTQQLLFGDHSNDSAIRWRVDFRSHRRRSWWIMLTSSLSSLTLQNCDTACPPRSHSHSLNPRQIYTVALDCVRRRTCGLYERLWTYSSGGELAQQLVYCDVIVRERCKSATEVSPLSSLRHVQHGPICIFNLLICTRTCLNSNRCAYLCSGRKKCTSTISSVLAHYFLGVRLDGVHVFHSLAFWSSTSPVFVGLAGVLEVPADVAGKRHRGADRGVLKSVTV